MAVRTQAAIENLAILEKRMQKESWHNTFWNKFSGDVEVNQDENGQKDFKLSGKPIEMLTQFIEEGRDNLLLPFLLDLVGAGVHGDTTLKGTGESMSTKWSRVYVNQMRKAVWKREGKMSEQRQKALRLFEQAQPLLSRWFTKVWNQEVARAYYEGLSQQLSFTNATDGLGIYKRYHPNFYGATGVGSTGVLKVAGTEGQTPTAAELDTSVGLVAGLVMTAKLLQAWRIKLLTLKIPQMVIEGGQKFYPIVMHPTSIAKLMNDTTFVAAQRAAYTGHMLKMPELSGAQYFYNEFAIYEDIASIRGWDDTNGGFFEDDDGSPMTKELNPTEIVDNTCSIVFGASSMARGIASRLQFTEEIDDHGNTQEIGGAIIDGFNRVEWAAEADAYETTGDLFRKNTTGGVASGLACLNTSSAILMTDDE